MPSGNLYIADNYNQPHPQGSLLRYPTFTLNNVGATNAGNYTVVITSPYGSVTSAVAALTVLLPPAIVVQPVSQGVPAGANATLIAVKATGTPPLSFLWYDNATNNWSRVARTAHLACPVF